VEVPWARRALRAVHGLVSVHAAGNVTRLLNICLLNGDNGDDGDFLGVGSPGISASRLALVRSLQGWVG